MVLRVRKNSGKGIQQPVPSGVQIKTDHGIAATCLVQESRPTTHFFGIYQMIENQTSVAPVSKPWKDILSVMKMKVPNRNTLCATGHGQIFVIRL